MLKVLLSCLLAACTFLCVSAQDAPDWEFQFNHSVDWSFSDNNAKIFFAYGDDILSAYQYIDKKLLWEVEIPKLSSDKITRKTKAPFFQISDVPSGRHLLMNYLNGEILVDTDWAESMKTEELYPVSDAELAILKGKKDKERVYALVRFKSGQAEWIRTLPVKLKRITLRNKFETYPRACGEHLLFVYADTLFSVDQKNGEVAWKQPEAESGLRYLLQQPFLFRTSDSRFFAIHHRGGKAILNAYESADGQPQWEAPFVVEGSYSISSKQDYFMVRLSHSFNYVSYKDGSLKWTMAPRFKEKITKVYEIENGFLVLLEDSSGAQYLSWVDKNGTVLLNDPIHVFGEQLLFVQMEGEELIYHTGDEVGLIDLNQGNKMTSYRGLSQELLYTHDAERESFVFASREDNTVFTFNYREGEYELVSNEITYEQEEESIQSLRCTPSGYAVLSDRTYYQVETGGQIIDKLHFEPNSKFNFTKAAFTLGGILGSVFWGDEMMQLNRDLMESGLIDTEQGWNNTLAMSTYGGAGKGMVGGAYGGQAYEALFGNREDKMAAAEFLNNKWILTDKLDRRKFGLRVINVDTGQQEKQVWLAKRSKFDYELVSNMRGIFVTQDDRLQFYSLE